MELDQWNNCCNQHPSPGDNTCSIKQLTELKSPENGDRQRTPALVAQKAQQYAFPLNH